MSSANSEKKVVVVQNVPISITMVQLEQHALSAFSGVPHKVTKKFMQEKNRTVFLEMENADVATTVMNFINRTPLNGHQLRADLSNRSNVTEEDVKNILVLKIIETKNPDKSLTCDDLAELFNSNIHDLGRVVRIQLWIKEGKVQGLVELSTKEAAQKAKEWLSGHKIKGVHIQLSYSNKTSIKLKQPQFGKDYETGEGHGECPVPHGNSSQQHQPHHPQAQPQVMLTQQQQMTQPQQPPVQHDRGYQGRGPPPPQQQRHGKGNARATNAHPPNQANQNQHNSAPPNAAWVQMQQGPYQGHHAGAPNSHQERNPRREGHEMPNQRVESHHELGEHSDGRRDSQHTDLHRDSQRNLHSEESGRDISRRESEGAHAQGGPGCCVLVNNILESTRPEALFRLFSVAGDVVAVKIIYKNRESALVQFTKAEDAAKACNFFHGCPFYVETRTLEVTQAKANCVTGPPDDLTQYFDQSPHHRFSGRQAKKNLQNRCGPSTQLHIANIPVDVDEKTMEGFLSKFSDNFDCNWMMNKASHEPRTKMCLVTMESVRSAVAALIGLHTFRIPGSTSSPNRGIAVSFSKARNRTIETDGLIMDPTRS